MKQYIVLMPLAHNYDDEENPMLDCCFASNRLANTQPIDGYELKLVLTDKPMCMDILAQEGEQINQESLLPYFVDTPIFDEEGEVIGYEPVTDLTDKLQTFAGRQWLY